MRGAHTEQALPQPVSFLRGKYNRNQVKNTLLLLLFSFSLAHIYKAVCVVLYVQGPKGREKDEF
jgi:hypothetical protein